MTRQSESATDASPTSHDEAPTFRSLSDCILWKKDSIFLVGVGGCNGIRLALVSSCGMVPCIRHGDTAIQRAALHHCCCILGEMPLEATG
jgi:hypothetical protein